MQTWFISDTHFGHEAVINGKMPKREFDNIEDHDDHLIDQINKYVQVKDRLYHLGDVAWHHGAEYMARINCVHKFLIVGNHDRANYSRGFKQTYDTLVLKVCGGTHKVFLSHYPHAYWPGSHRGHLHAYGHIHSQREAYLDVLWPQRRAMDVGVDNLFRLYGEYRPISEEELVAKLSCRQGHDQVSWYEAFRKHGLGEGPPPPGPFDEVLGNVQLAGQNHYGDKMRKKLEKAGRSTRHISMMQRIFGAK